MAGIRRHHQTHTLYDGGTFLDKTRFIDAVEMLYSVRATPSPLI
jgi:hypothetical protein